MFTSMTEENRNELKILLLITLITILLSVAEHTWNYNIIIKIIFFILYIVAGKQIIKKAFLGIKNRQPLDENFLMTLATLAAMAIGNYHEAVFVLLFYKFGELFEEIATNKSKDNIKSLIDIVPERSIRIEAGGKREEVDIDEIEIGDILEITDGERIPVDGVVVEGNATLDTSSLTGEALPQDVEIGSELMSSSIVTDGIIRMKALKEFDDSIASKIIELIEEGVENKSESEKYITKFARIYTPVVVIGAIILAVIPPLFGGDWRDYLLRAATFLVLSCPCALVLSVPLSFISGLGLASKNGILIKGSEYLEDLDKADVILTDKTGTLTKGNFLIKDIEYYSDYDKQKILDYIYNIEKTSNHPIAKAITSNLNREDKELFTQVKNIKGLGVSAISKDGETVSVGSKKFVGFDGNDDKAIFISIDDYIHAKIIIEDEIKEDSLETISQLKKYVSKLAIVSGDNKKSVESCANQLGLDSYYYNLLPDEKMEVLNSYKKDHENIVYIGDGINDAPVLKQAKVGISMGETASDLAIESSDVLIVNGEFSQVLKLMKIAKLSMKTVRENIAFIMIVKFSILILGLIGHANMWLAIFGDVGVSIIAILWAMRILSKKL